MNKEALLQKVRDYLHNDLQSCCKQCEEIISSVVEDEVEFRSSNPPDCCLSTAKSLLHFFIEEYEDSKYIATKSAMFGGLGEIRRDGFERRYQHNIKITNTYIAAYNKTEGEYVEIFSKRRYASYDSFRNVRNRQTKKK